MSSCALLSSLLCRRHFGLLAGLLGLCFLPGPAQARNAAHPSFTKDRQALATTPASSRLAAFSPQSQDKGTPDRTASKAETHRPFPSLGLPVEKLKPLPGGTGLLLCEPVANNVPADLADFGSGCGRWLQFVVCGQPQLGKTSAWAGVDFMGRQQGYPNLRLMLPEAAKIAGLLGMTHMAVGTVQGSTAKCTLAYQVWRLSPRQVVGAPLTVSGSQTQILAQLPRLARALSMRLGISAPSIPSSVGASVEETAFLGQMADKDGNAYSPAQVTRLGQLAARLPLAGMLYLGSPLLNYMDADVKKTAAQTLWAQAPENTLVHGQILLHTHLVHAADIGKMITIIRRYPQNYIYATIDLDLQAISQDRAAVVRVADHMIELGYNKSGAWLRYGQAIRTLSEEVRQGRFWEEMSPAEQQYVSIAYQRWLQATQHAVKLMPQYGYAWLELSRAATFAGEQEAAVAAYWKAARLDQGDPELYGWGLQMFQSKWGGDTSKLPKVARLAAEDPYSTPDKMMTTAGILADENFEEEARALYRRASEQYHKLLETMPSNIILRADYAGALGKSQQLEAATQEYRKLLALKPDNTEWHASLGYILFERQMWDDSIQEYRQAIRLNPEHLYAHMYVGFDLIEKGQYDQAEPEFRRALQIDPNAPRAHMGMGDVYAGKHKLDETEREYKEAVRLAPNWAFPYKRLSNFALENKHYDTAIDAQKTAVRLNPRDMDALSWLALDYHEAHQLDDSLKTLRELIRLDPKNAWGHVYLGKVLLEKGQKAEAQAEWKLVLTLDKGKNAEEAKKMLEQNP